MDDFFNNELIDRFESMLDENERWFFEAEEFYEIIAYYLDVGDMEYARYAIDYGQDLYPDNLDILVKELEYQIAMDNLILSEKLIKRLDSVMAEDGDFIICKAKYWSLRKNHKKAIEYYTKALGSGEDLNFIHNCLGNEYLSLQEIGKAIQHFKMALEDNLEDDYALMSCVECFEDLHRHKECIDFLLQYIDLRPYSDFAWSQLGVQYQTIKDFDEAFRAFDYASIIDDTNLNYISQKGYCLEQLHDFEGAIKVYEDAFENGENSAFIFLKIGYCQHQLQDPIKALKAFQQAILADPQLDKSWASSAEIYEELGHYEDALYHIEKAIELTPNQTDYLKRRAYLCIKLGKMEETLVIYHQLIRIESVNFYNWLGYSEMLINLGEYRKAIKILTQGTEKFNRAELFYQLSNCYFLLNDDENGVAQLEKAYQINPSIKDEMYMKYPILESKSHLSSVIKDRKS